MVYLRCYLLLLCLELQQQQRVADHPVKIFKYLCV